MLVIALTGGIGSGKSTVSEIFKSKNIPIIDTDIIAREIVEQDKPAYDEIIKIFGTEILNKEKNIDRQALRKLIFSSSKKRLQLENILHPIIWNEVASQLALITGTSSILDTSISPKSNTPAYCIVVVPLLLENSSRTNPVKFDRILVIDAPEELQLERTINRDHSTVSIIKNIMKSQVSRQVRLDAADDVILNTENLDSLNKQVDDLHRHYLELAK